MNNEDTQTQTVPVESTQNTNESLENQEPTTVPATEETAATPVQEIAPVAPQEIPAIPEINNTVQNIESIARDPKNLVQLKKHAASKGMPPLVRFEDGNNNFFELKVSIIDGKWTLQTNEGANLDFLVESFFSKLLIEAAKQFNKRVELFSGIDFLGSLYVDDKEYILRVKDGERYINGIHIDEFIKTIDPELQHKLIKVALGSFVKDI